MSRYRGTSTYDQVHAELVRAAQYEGLTTYPDIAAIMDIPTDGGYEMQDKIGAILHEICEDEVAAGRPMLSAVAVKTTKRPGPGFFTQALELDRFRCKTRNRKTENRFWAKERRAVYKEWKRPLPS